jgi:hypothetical protein
MMEDKGQEILSGTILKNMRAAQVNEIIVIFLMNIENTTKENKTPSICCISC